MTEAQTETTRVSYKTMHEEVQTENAQLLRLLKNNREAMAQLIALVNADGVDIESFAEGKKGSTWDHGYRDGKKDAYKKYNRRIRRTASELYNALTKDADEILYPHQIGDCKIAFEKQRTDPKVHAMDRVNDYESYRACSNCKNDAYESHISRYQGEMRKEAAAALTAASDRSIKQLMKTTKEPRFGTEGVGVSPRVS